MDIDPNPAPPLEIAHVLFVDIVAYSTLHMDRQQRVLNDLQEAVRNTPTFVRAQAEDQLIRLPTGDGMALVFFRDPEAPVRCALELTKALRNHPDIKVRMGIHTGPVYRIADINANRNVAGGGINIAQRVMDCGDAGHILISGAGADVLFQISSWSPMLYDLGEVEVKHAIRVHLYNFYTDGTGNPERPRKTGMHRVSIPQPRLWSAKAKWIPRRVIVPITVVVLGAMAGWLVFAHRAKALGPTDTLVIADVTNKTDDGAFDETLRQGLIFQLNQSPFLKLVSSERIQKKIASMGQPADSPVSSDLARQVCRQVGGKAYLNGSVEGSNNSYTVSIKATNCGTGRTIAEERIQALNRENVLKAITQVSTRIREGFGESKESIQEFNLSLDVATSSLEAFHSYALGRRKLETDLNVVDAVRFFQEAIRWDANFAMAYASLASCYRQLRRIAPDTENAKKAYELRDRLSKREQFVITSGANFPESFIYVVGTKVFDNLAGDEFREADLPSVEKATAIYEDWVRTYPRDGDPHFFLGVIHYRTGQYEKALEEFRESLRLDPDCSGCQFQSPTYSVVLYLFLNRLSEARAHLKEISTDYLDRISAISLHSLSYEIAFLQNDSDEMAQEVRWASDHPEEALSTFVSLEANSAAYFGKLKEARKMLNSRPEFAAWSVLDETLLECLFGDLEECQQRAESAFDQYGLKLGYETPAFALTLTGETRRPDRFLEKWAKKFTATRLNPTGAYPLVRAQLWLNRKNPEHAVEILKTCTPRFPICTYLRAYANLAVPHLDDAEADFQAILDHRGMVVNDPVGALARVGLGRARSQKGDTEGAKTAYEDFFTLWKDADPDIPILKQAKVEYAKLQ